MRSLLTRLAFAAGVALLVLVGVLLAVLPSPGEERARSVFSTQPSGLRALFLLCESLGFSVEPWSEAPGGLDGRGALLVLTQLPEAPPPVPGAPATGDEGATPLRRSRDLAHYRRFVEEGGTLLTALGAKPDDGEAELDFLRETLALPGLEDIECVPLEDTGLDRGVVLVGDERLALESEVRLALRASEAVEVLARAEDGSALVLARPVALGRVVLATFPLDLLENRSLGEDGEPALLFVRILERLASLALLERVLFDEYALGGWRPEPIAALAFSPRLAWLSAHVLLFFLVLGWRSAWSGPFPRDPEPLLAASPLARARGFGRTLARAGRFDLLARLLRRGVLERLAPRAIREPEAEAPELEPRLRALARGDEKRLARLRELFVARAPRDGQQLAALAADLAALEGELVAAGEAGKTRRNLGARPSRTGS